MSPTFGFDAVGSGYTPPPKGEAQPKAEPRYRPMGDPVIQANELNLLLQKAAEGLEDAERFFVYRDDPVGFCRDILGINTLWSRQREILKAIVDHRKLSIRSGHGVGKTFILAVACIWWLLARRGLVITTASTWPQVKKVLWKEIHRLIAGSKVPLPIDVYNTELRVGGSRDWYAIGMSTDNPTAFQGHHDPNLLVVVDEAPGIEGPVHESISSLTTDEGNRTVMIGNPTDPSGPFYESQTNGVWEVKHISCMDHPNVKHGKQLIPGAVSRMWVEEKLAEYGSVLDPRYQVRVLGEFPEEGSHQLISIAAVEKAMGEDAYETQLEEGRMFRHPVVWGLDVARFGENKTVLARRRGDCIESMESWGGMSTMHTANRVATSYAMCPPEDRPTWIIVDEIGVGGGVMDRLVELGLPILGFHAGGKAQRHAHYDNLRSEAWFRLKERLAVNRLWLPRHPTLKKDLVTPKYSFTPGGQVRLERKEQLERRGVDSPDFADAVMMAFAMDMQGGYADLSQPGYTWDRADTSRDPTSLPSGDEYATTLVHDMGGVPVHWF